MLTNLNVGDLHAADWGEGPLALMTPIKLTWVGVYKINGRVSQPCSFKDFRRLHNLIRESRMNVDH